MTRTVDVGPRETLVVAVPDAGRRYLSLDSVRGLAALCVVFTHMFGPVYFKTDASLSTMNPALVLFQVTPLRVLWHAGAAVIIFFVLSGFVLSLPYCDGRPPRYGPYLVRRTCRIYIPYIVAVGCAVALKLALYHGPFPASREMNQEWGLPTTARSLLDHLALITSTDQRYDPVTWSLTHEMRISIVFPLIMAVVLGLPTAVTVLLALAGVVVGIRGDSLLRSHLHWNIDVFLTVIYIPMFIAGALVARHRTALAGRFAALAWPIRLALALVAISLLAYHDLIPFNIARLPVQLYAQTLGAAMLIVVALGWARCSDWLSRPVPVFLGRISYSLYLYHLLVLLALANLIRAPWPNSYVPLLAFCLTIPVSYLAYRLIEEPSIGLGRSLARRLSAAPGRRPPVEVGVEVR
ncbi:MAG TPA: acyltransferase [Isosphaeraceae bacterium]|jgi:peptidoglycan/LPS O-acetylase OafA/YrhL